MGRVYSLAQSVQAVLTGMFWLPDTYSDFELNGWDVVSQNSAALKTQTRASPHPCCRGDKGRRGGLLFCVHLLSLSWAASSVQLNGAAVLLGLFCPVILLARPHQAVQQVSCRMQRSQHHSCKNALKIKCIQWRNVYTPTIHQESLFQKEFKYLRTL